MPAGARHAASYWAATAGPLPVLGPATNDLDTDVVIVGGGFTGLSTAWHLHRAGRHCVVLEANEIGWGASGRNGGMVVPRYKFTFPTLEARYGREVALEMYRGAHAAVDTVERIVADCAIDCDFARSGHLTPMVHRADVGRFTADVRWLADHAGDRRPAMLDAAEAAHRIGTAFYTAACFEPRGGGIHPLRYCIGLASVLAARGVTLFVHTPALSWRKDGDGIVVKTRGARIRARQLVLATNGYSDLAPVTAALRCRVVPMVSSLIATAPLPDPLRRSILPQGHLATDAKRLTNYYRMMPDGRFVFGGRGGASNRESPAIYRRLARDMVRLFPQLGGTAIDHRWSGRVAVTIDGLPHAGRIDDRVSYAVGYNGRGVALSALLGGMLARFACGEPATLGAVTAAPFDPIPFHALRVPAKQAAIAWFRVLDALGA